ncbi:ATP-binding protein [Nonomuraea rhodomycinica]|uniref:AAA family ATPase n=1 Tax=Nonomuraea rhodomycinica TaxID=1712872 RepID=A0A7Y6IRP3_9ACTN|nr:AAA family ATPase [Nonomuraea rhodomycinica]NUW41874.1 AAA family ATPase [Nonomuraea rhodomycinica]
MAMVRDSTFVGRRHEVAAARKALARARLLTLTGTGGVGKSRLAVRVADAVRGAFRDGVEVVELATLQAGELLAASVANDLGLRDGESDPMALLVDHLAERRMLLVLDNCEHLLEECARFVSRLLREAPRLRVLATSRQRLGVYGEQVLTVQSLPVPDPGLPPHVIARHDAVRLFADRAAGASPGFELTRENAGDVAWLARRLDGLPLAIELAAARLRAMSLERLVSELDDPLRDAAPTSGTPPSPLPPRQRTLGATMEWSYRLCSPGEQRLWARLAMFPGGAGLETAEAVCSGGAVDPAEVLDLAAGLVDKSILVPDRAEGGVRYRMLGTIRAYGRDRLTGDEERELRERYLTHHHDLVLRTRIHETVPDQLERYRLLRRELPNLRAAIELSLGGTGPPAVGLEMAAELWSFWLLSGAATEGRYWLERGLERVPAPSRGRATALWVYSMLALRQGDPAAAAPRLEECRALSRRDELADVLPYAVRTSGVAAFSTGEPERGLALLKESLARHRSAGDLDGVAFNLYYAAAYGARQNPEQAAAYGEEMLELCDTHGAPVTRGYAQLVLGIALWNLGELRRAETLVGEAAGFTCDIDDKWCLTQCVEVLAWAAGARGDHERAAGLLGAAHALWQVVDASPNRLSYLAPWHEQCAARARRALGVRAYEAAFREGVRLGRDPRLLADPGRAGPARAREGTGRPG